MKESLPFERESARLTAPDWYDFHYFRRLKRVVTPMSLMGALLVAFGVFIILTCLYVVIAAAVIAERGSGMLIVVGAVETVIIGVSIWAFAHDYETRRKERRLTPYGRRFNAWLESDFVPWIRENLAIYIDPEDAEELIINKAYTHVSFRGVSKVVVSYEDGDIVIRRDVLKARGVSSILDEQSLSETY